MVILHIACISNSLFNGVCVAVPQHVNAQKKYAEVGFINIRQEIIESIDTQLQFIMPFRLKDLPAIFSKPDLVVFHEAYRPEYLQISHVLRKKKIPYVIIPHGELRKEAQKKKFFKKCVANILLFNTFIENATAIQCLSEMELHSTKFGKYKFVGTNGITIPCKKKTSFNNVGVKFIYIGRYEVHVKGLDIMLEAVRLKADLMRKYQCSLEMYGPDILGRYAQVETLIQEKEISDIVTLNYEISGKEKERKLLEADVFIQTSRHEGMPMGILEALSYGVPCLVTEGTSLSKQIEDMDCGWGANTEEKSVAEQIENIIKENLIWMEKSQNAILFVQNQFSWEKIAKDMIDKYEEIIK